MRIKYSSQPAILANLSDQLHSMYSRIAPTAAHIVVPFAAHTAPTLGLRGHIAVPFAAHTAPTLGLHGHTAVPFVAPCVHTAGQLPPNHFLTPM